MFCVICGGICDYHTSRMCEGCRKTTAEYNARVEAYSLLRLAEEYCPVHLREKIERFWDRHDPDVKRKI